MSNTYFNFINGEWVPSKTNETYASINPAKTDEIVGFFQQSNEEDVELAIQASENAFLKWSRTAAPKRGDVIFNLIQLLESNKEELAVIITKEVGKSLREAHGEVRKTIEAMKQFSGEATRLTGETIPSQDNDIFGYTIREPLGVVGVIAPYNFPLGIGIWKIAPAIIAGNTVVFKPASNTSLISVKIMELFEEAGVPAGVINMVTGPGGVIGSAIGNHPKIKAVSFTGSTDVGLALGKAVTARGAKMQAEMGGKNPSIILEDANIDETVENLVISGFLDNGQRCTGTSRVIVLKSIAKELIEKLVKRAEKLVIADGFTENVDNGPVIDEGQLNTYLHYVHSAIDEGATLEYGGKRLTDDGKDKGYFVLPTIFSNVTKEMTINREEIFGPVMGITIVDTYEEAIELANDNEFGLSSTIYTNDMNKAFHFIREIESGVTHVNIPSNYFENQYPFGGKKASSIGPREQGSTALDFWTEYKTVYIKA
ncbi:putative aldehyde dehydrogenase YcbD [Oceanobacillus oncorhynchi subsp. incaldanensis]|uniref:aldehyde dehydrogenase family protein n=1 Tax=Oceanobacillus TaxID=182709 RepID=UPI001B05B30F|nr:aldehyde dehydrogenase family protein [Oceanobacillus oncorhynchi]UUI41554.1 aldehyde dehydrogenase family protein [Oceanobacillus oncorhynchi]GIO17692.1 putative aldehyde dehydrogenase YcbD [Oceanobacillus oncorhynchi subsp. incaldanensis]